MKSYFIENFYTSIFISAFSIITVVRLLIWFRLPKPRSNFFSSQSILISGILSAVVIFVGFFVAFFIVSNDVLTENENKYTEIKSGKPRILIMETETYENIGKPTYMGKKIVMDGFKVTDTIFPVALFQKGRETDGKYMLVNYKGKQFWMKEYGNYSLEYCEYTYYKTSSYNFVAADENENVLFWRRATNYVKEWDSAHENSGALKKKYSWKENGDLEYRIFNDTLINVKYFLRDGGDEIRISRKEGREKYLYTAKKLVGKSDRESKVLAYFIQNGEYYRGK